MITSTSSNNIDPYLAQDVCNVKPFTKVQEFSGVDFLIERNSNLTVYSDTHYATEQIRHSNKTVYMLAEVINDDIVANGLLITTKKTDVNAFRAVLTHSYGAIKTTTSCVVFNEKTSEIFSKVYNRVYDNGHVFIFYT
jgi:hypothetical protein